MLVVIAVDLLSGHMPDNPIELTVVLVRIKTKPWAEHAHNTLRTDVISCMNYV